MSERMKNHPGFMPLFGRPGQVEKGTETPEEITVTEEGKLNPNKAVDESKPNE